LCKGCRFEISGRLTVLFHVLALHNHVQAMMHLRTKTSHIKGVVYYKPNQLGFPLHDMEKDGGTCSVFPQQLAFIACFPLPALATMIMMWAHKV